MIDLVVRQLEAAGVDVPSNLACLKDVIPAKTPWADVLVKVLKVREGNNESTAQVGLVTDGVGDAFLVVWRKSTDAGIPPFEEGKCYLLKNARLWSWNGKLQVTVNTNTTVIPVERVPSAMTVPVLLAERAFAAGRVVKAYGTAKKGYFFAECDVLSRNVKGVVIRRFAKKCELEDAVLAYDAMARDVHPVYSRKIRSVPRGHFAITVLESSLFVVEVGKTVHECRNVSHYEEEVWSLDVDAHETWFEKSKKQG